jgi:hypothetical protein
MASMSPISSKAFVVQVANAVDAQFRAARRVIFNADVLKAYNVFAGDIVVVLDTDSAVKVRVSSVS